MGVKGLNRGGLPGAMSWTEIMVTMYLLEKIAPLPELDARFGGGHHGVFYLVFFWQKGLSCVALDKVFRFWVEIHKVGTVTLLPLKMVL